MQARIQLAPLTRRRCLAGLAATSLGLRGDLARAARPPRIACLEWTSAEMVISLGIGPVAVADTKGYRDWVAGPALPAGCIDLGSRGEPNLELKPDLITGAYGFGLDEAPFKRIAPLPTVPFYDGSEAPYRQAEIETLKLGSQLGREAEAQRLIQETAATIAEIRGRFSERAKRPLAVVSMFDDRHVRVYGKGSLFHDVLDRLSLTNAWTAPPIAGAFPCWASKNWLRSARLA
ncbi:ABC transporter substrate-binding protein [Mesorhizobium sp. M1312]|uniref:ABC transporter substrate-binding protein n=1 Tax=unclassified Mesorhizobium TaxID=325217 RepID=UPI00333C9ED8